MNEQILRVRRVLAEACIRPDAELGQGLSATSADAVGKRLGPLPDDYVEFLTSSGWLSIGAEEVFGGGPGVPTYLDVVALASAERADGGLPIRLVPISNDGGGNLTCIDTDLVAQGVSECVVRWDHELRRDDAMGQTFADWLATLVERAT